MTGSKQRNSETETNEMSEAALSQASGGIIAVMPQKTQTVAMGDGSVKPAPQTNAVLIGLLKS